MTLHDRIMAIDSPVMFSGVSFIIQSDAAQLAAEADELIQDLSAALSMYVRAGHGMSTDFCQQGDARRASLDALTKYNAYKEQSE